MTYTLSKNIQVGQRIKTAKGWRKINAVVGEGAMVKEGIVPFGSTIYGWKAT
jgi:hypothetical protein